MARSIPIRPPAPIPLYKDGQQVVVDPGSAAEHDYRRQGYGDKPKPKRATKKTPVTIEGN